MSTAETTDLVPRVDEAPPRPQYMVGFEGMASEPFPKAAREVLAEPPPPEAVEIKPNGIVFVPGVYYRRQLTRAFGAGGWALAPRSPARVMGNIITYHGALFCLGRFVAEAVGECAYRANNDQMSYASALEGAKTDALSRCCKDLGLATQLWDKAWRDQWMADYAEKGSDGKWRARDGRPVQDIDLMSGAGGVAPKGPAPSVTASAPVATPAPATVVAPPDAGEAATDVQKAAIRAAVKALKWKGSYAKIWLRDATGVDSVEALSIVQADTALAALEAEAAK
jgi:ribonuclease HI